MGNKNGSIYIHLIRFAANIQYWYFVFFCFSRDNDIRRQHSKFSNTIRFIRHVYRRVKRELACFLIQRLIDQKHTKNYYRNTYQLGVFVYPHQAYPKLPYSPSQDVDRMMVLRLFLLHLLLLLLIQYLYNRVQHLLSNSNFILVLVPLFFFF